jgi:hypothetical protein
MIKPSRRKKGRPTMMQNEVILESLSRQWQQERRAEAEQHRTQTWLHNLRKLRAQAGR